MTTVICSFSSEKEHGVAQFICSFMELLWIFQGVFLFHGFSRRNIKVKFVLGEFFFVCFSMCVLLGVFLGVFVYVYFPRWVTETSLQRQVLESL